MGDNNADDATAKPTEQTRIQAMLSSLGALLDPVPNARKVLPHLAALETDLARHGLFVLQGAPMHALLKASEELASLPIRPNDLALQDLGTLLLGELESRSRPRRQYLSTFVSPDKLEVSEGSHTDFLALYNLPEHKAR